MTQIEIWIWVLILGIIGGLAHQIAEAFIPNMRKTNLLRSVGSGILGAIVIAIVLGVFSKMLLTPDIMLMLIVAGYAGDSVIINLAKRDVGGLSKLIEQGVENTTNNLISNFNTTLDNPPPVLNTDTIDEINVQPIEEDSNDELEL